MATTDSNGLVLLEATDNLVPLQTTINGVTASVSTALNNNVRTFKAASVEARNTLATQRTPSATNPLVVWRTDKKWWDVNDGSGWKSIHPDPNMLVVNGTGYPASGVVSGEWTSAGGSYLNGVYVKYHKITMPFKPPSGWRFMAVGMQETGGAAWSFQSGTGQDQTLGVEVFSLNGSARIQKLGWTLVRDA